MTCEDCGHASMIFTKELDRRHYPRCEHCGGFCIPSKRNRKHRANQVQIDAYLNIYTKPKKGS
jgi:hypothetical protein